MAQSSSTPHLPPEILLSIFRMLEGHDKTLLSAALVCQEWFEPATDILWRDVPPIALSKVSYKRRQSYANKISELYFRNIDEAKFHAQYKNLKFPRLKCIGLDMVRLKKNQKLHLSQYIGPRLESFSYWGGHPCEDALERLETECPRLHDLHLVEPLELVVDADRLKKFLTNRTSLRNLEFGRGWEYSLPPEVLAHVLTLGHLERLDLVPFLRPHRALKVFGSSNQFKNIHILHIRLHSESVGLLAAAAAASVDTLFLEAQEAEHDVLQALEPMKKLRHLEIEIHNLSRGIELSQEGIKSLGTLRELEVLLIRTWTKGRVYYHNIRAPWLGDEQFADLMSDLPKLKSVAFQVECNITLKSITALSKTHPEMYCCDLYGTFDLDDWARSGPPIFPELRRLAMDAPNLRGRTRASSTSLSVQVDRIIDIILQQLPMLEQLGFHDFERNVLADQVLEKYATRIGGHFNERQATAFRPWSWMEKNRKILVVCLLLTDLYLQVKCLLMLSSSSGIQGKLLTTPSRMLKLILPLTTRDVNKDRKDVEPLALLVHPQQPLSYLERLIQSELPVIKNENGNDKIPAVHFRAQDLGEEAISPDRRAPDDESEDYNFEHSEDFKIDGKTERTGKLNESGEVTQMKPVNPVKEPDPEHPNFVRWSPSTEIGDFIRDAARGKEFSVDIEGAPEPIFVAVPSFADRTYYLRMRLRKTARQISSLADIKAECDKLAHRSAQRVAQGGFAVLVGWWGSVYVLTFQTDLGWDVMEPVTYLVGLSTLIGGYMWFLYHNREVSYRSAMNFTVSKRQDKLYQAKGFDVSKWDGLVEEGNRLRREIKMVAEEYDVDWDEAKEAGDEKVAKALRNERKKKQMAKDDEDEEGKKRKKSKEEDDDDD
ncbi:hypothetical protein QM012_006799 [Aureobasidium pullulans]|uniref:Calcium uniporter protein, mitochondrial n=1 Tax=Aureobasidium pullulans TaxID=5580 RepID=A0ABR0TPL1_AURPU